ncbi:MAG: hypothetical protein IKA71_04660 [Lentisphaeria bacterium]|nr:hypothetical protein [Lentisphaeria bacterium]
MNISELPCGSAPAPAAYPYFPTRWQHVLYRNWSLVPPEVLADILNCDVTAVITAAQELGLPGNTATVPQWRTSGYLTLIRNNWQLLDYEQLLKLLDFTPERLAYTLKEEDFCFYKLGQLKPACPKVRYTPLTPEQQKRTEQIRELMLKHFPGELQEYVEPPFAFTGKYHSLEPAGNNQDTFEFNFIHSYAASCGDVLGEAELCDPVPENLLAQYASMGIKGVWLHALLYLLCPIPGAEEFSAGHDLRLKNLQLIAQRCAKYGIKIYLYLNEPRSMPPAFYEKFPHWGGRSVRGTRTLCTAAAPEILEYLEHAMRFLFTQVPELGGALTITMSENPTHCHFDYHGSECPMCRNIPQEKIIADINRAMERGMHAAAPDARMLCFDWAWRRSENDSEVISFKKKVIDLLPKNKNVYVVSVSEWGLITRVGGVEQYLVDYSISQPGPAEEAKAVWQYAKAVGLGTVAKIQINNSWELSAIPNIPVPYLVKKHLDNLRASGVDGVMLSWTLGGYPGGNLEMLNASPEEIAAVRFAPEIAGKVVQAWKIFSDAFSEFPFNVNVIYTAPVNYGPMNILHAKSTGYQATMVGFPYDDLNSWRAVYPEDIFISQFQKLSEKWAEGIAVLESVSGNTNAGFAELLRISTAAYCHFRSTFLQSFFVRARNAGDRETMRKCATEEQTLAIKLYHIARVDSRIGFEASNHYYYTLNDLREKVINCDYILNEELS